MIKLLMTIPIGVTVGLIVNYLMAQIEKMKRKDEDVDNVEVV